MQEQFLCFSTLCSAHSGPELVNRPSGRYVGDRLPTGTPYFYETNDFLRNRSKYGQYMATEDGHRGPGPARAWARAAAGGGWGGGRGGGVGAAAPGPGPGPGPGPLWPSSVATHWPRLGIALHFCIPTAFCSHYDPKGGHVRPWPEIICPSAPDIWERWAKSIKEHMYRFYKSIKIYELPVRL